MRPAPGSARTTRTWTRTCAGTSRCTCGGRATAPLPLPPDALAYYATLHNDGPHGGPFRYRSILTDVLAWVLERASGARLHELISAELWQADGRRGRRLEITVDGHGNPMADGGICATLRDLGRFGLLYATGGGGIIPAVWIADT